MFSSQFRRLILAATVFVLIGSTPAGAAPEFRGIWVDAWGAGFLNASDVTTLVNRCNTYNFNAVVVQMRRRGDAFYMPQAPNGDPRTTAIAADFDALQEVINQCHAANPPIEVHVWVTTQLIWSSTSAPSQPGHVYNLHPEYLQKDSSGATFLSEGYYLDPGNPDAALWNHNMAMDIVNHYDIDGFHWDYCRYPVQDSGYNAVAVARYNAEYGLSGQPAPADAQWSTWRRRQMTDFLRWTNADILAAKPNVVVSSSVFGSRSDAYTYRFQDWAAWNTEGIHDICCPMNYTSDNPTFNSRVDDAYNNQGIRRVYMGQGAYLNTKENTVVQLTYCRNKPLLGTLFYSYRTPNSGTVDQTGTFSYVKTNYQPTYESVPTIPWKANPTKGIAKGTVTRQDTGEVVYNATVTLNTPSPRTQKSEAHGKYAFFEADPGTYTVEATVSGMGVGSAIINITAGLVSTADIVIPAGDTTPPTISNVASGNITENSAVITWTTNESSDSTVEYGLTTSYGSTKSDSAMVLSHSVSLTGLAASTTYHYRVKSKDASNNEAVSGDYTLTTNAPGQVSDIIIDNPQATMVGTWSTGTSSVDKYGADYRYKGQGTGTAYGQFTPSILTAGTYQVYEWHPQGSNRTVAAPHVITYNGGTATVNVNQQTGGGTWNLLGTYSFAAGTSGNVKIQDNFPDAGMVVMVDAIKFVYAGAPPAVPAAPSNLTATTVSRSEINLGWTDNSSNETNFVVEYKKSKSSTWLVAATLPANTTSYSKTGLSRNTSYDFRVKATNAAGSSAYSNIATAKTLK